MTSTKQQKMTTIRRWFGVKRVAPVIVAGAAVAAAVVLSGGTADASGRTLPSASPGSLVGIAGHPISGVKPTIVLVHGAWADASSWNGEVIALQHAGYVVRAVPNPVENLTTDSEFVADFLKTISGPIVLVGHSYGGSVITNAAAGNPDVKALVYVDAAAPAPGETNGSLSGADSALAGDPATLYDMVPYPGAPTGAMELYLKKAVFLKSFGSDLPTATDDRLWAEQRGASTAAFGTPSKYAAWQTIPSWYFISTGDKIITPTSELAMADRAHSEITLFHGGSHLTLISHPAAVTAVIESAARSVR